MQFDLCSVATVTANMSGTGTAGFPEDPRQATAAHAWRRVGHACSAIAAAVLQSRQSS